MGLNHFKRRSADDEAVWVDLGPGVRVKIRELNTPSYQKALLEYSDISTVSELKDPGTIEKKMADGMEIIINLMSYYIIDQIDDDGVIISDDKAIFDIVSDESMWEFRERVLEEARVREHFVTARRSDIVGNSEPSPSLKKNGEGVTPKKGESGQTSINSESGRPSLESQPLA